MKKDLFYTKIMNQLEVIHAENLSIISLILLSNGADPKRVNELTDRWDKRFKEERDRW